MIDLKKRFTLPLIAILLFILLFLIGVTYFLITYEKPITKINTYLIENEKLEKIDLQLEDNESYTYFVSSIENFNVTYLCKEYENNICIQENILNLTNILCIDNKGLQEGGLNSNVSYSLPIYLFKPWMLAIEKNWSWNLTDIVYVDSELKLDFDKISTINFKAIGEETILGRDTYKIEKSKNNMTEYYWIDKEKRILIKKEGIENIILIDAPFKLVQPQVE